MAVASKPKLFASLINLHLWSALNRENKLFGRPILRATQTYLCLRTFLDSKSKIAVRFTVL